jgi:hypothetical protein
VRVIRWAGIAALLLVASALLGSLYASERVTAASADRFTRAQLAHLAEDLEQRADGMQRLFPEGRVFTLALYGAAWVNVGRHALDLAELARARGECSRALKLLEAPGSLLPFAPAGDLPHGMFYEAWTNRVRAGCLLLDAAPLASPVLPEFGQSCDRLVASLEKRGPFVDSYPGQAWPADSVVGVASLPLCAKWLGPRYQSATNAWLSTVQRRLDAETGLLPHSAESAGARGSSAALMLAFLPDVDAAFARRQYLAFRQHFSSRLFGLLPSFDEYPDRKAGPADLDSGPLVFGVSAPATVVGIAAARSNHDFGYALALRSAAEAIGLGSERNGKRSYGFGALPVGEAFLAWASGAEPWTTAPEAATMTDDAQGWRGRFRLFCVGGALLCVFGASRLSRATRSSKRRAT